jgi:transcriptional regulator with XRE-family HTH domain
VAIQLNTRSRGLDEVVRLERQAFAAKVRIVRAVLGWSQTELGRRAGLTQRAIHKLEQGETEPRRTTVLALEAIWREQHIEFEELPGGGFRTSVHPSMLETPSRAKSRRLPS